MQGRSPGPKWRLKVINGCQLHEDVVLPVVPQPSELQQFYSVWFGKEDGMDSTVPLKSRKRKRSGKRVVEGASRKGIPNEDWLNKIPHVTFGRHKCLPRSTRLRHVCISRLHCRVAYVSNPTTHRLILSLFPSVDKEMATIEGPDATFSTANNGRGHRYSASEQKDTVNLENYEEPSALPGPHYRLLNTGFNPVYVNDKQLLRGRSARLRENDIIAFLENPFDEEGGVLQPLLPEDMAQLGAEPRASANGGRPLPNQEAALSDASGCSDSAGILPVDSLQAPCQFPTFVEVNGHRIARYRRPLSTFAPLSTSFGQHGCGGDSSLRTPLKHSLSLSSTHAQSPPLDANYTCLSASEPHAQEEVSTPTKRLSSSTWCGGVDRLANRDVLEVINGEGVVDDVVSPLQQRVVSTPPRCFTEPHHSLARSFTVIPPQLPVYVFSQRSPSPEGSTNQNEAASRGTDRRGRRGQGLQVERSKHDRTTKESRPVMWVDGDA
ncbi:hypothetical protein ERJ75_001333900 [Trypanosoma vivax]|nr:hypothetical protein ERJ75_001333900 [Trypanosoma vivax]